MEQLGDFQGERQLYIDAVRLQPLNWRAWLELGEFEARQQDYPRAIPPLERAVQLDPQSTLPGSRRAQLAGRSNASGRSRPEPDLRPEGREQPVDERLGQVRSGLAR